MHAITTRLRLSNGMSRLLLAVVASCWLLAAPALAQRSAAAESRATPASQALKIYKALGAQDYRSLFYLIAFTEAGQTTLSTPEQFALDMDTGYASSFKTSEARARSDAILKSISDIMIGEPEISGNLAHVPTSSHITIDGQVHTFRGVAHLILDRGVWKLDLTIDEDSEKAMAQRTTELLGKPEQAVQQ